MAGKKHPFNGDPTFAHHPFSVLDAHGLPPGLADHADDSTGAAKAPKKHRGRVDIKRERAGRGGKTVTIITGFIGIGLPEKEKLAEKIQKSCGTGGTVKDGRIEIQGDKRAEAARIVAEAGFQPVWVGG